MRSFQTPREWPGLTVMENMLLATPIEGREAIWRGLFTPVGSGPPNSPTGCAPVNCSTWSVC